MPFTYTTRKGMTMTLYRVESAKGAVRYIFARPGKSKGELVEAIPPGYRVSEHVGGKVSLVKDEPRLVLSEEIAAVETEIAKLPKAKDFRVVAQHDRVEIYTKVPRGLPNLYLARLGGRSWRAAEDRDRKAPDTYDPVLRFVLYDAERRRYRADQVVPGWHVAWSWLGRMGDVAELAGTFVPALASKAAKGSLLQYYDFDMPTLPGESEGLTVEFADAELPDESDLFGIPGLSYAGDFFAEGPRPRRGDTRPDEPLTSVHRLKVTLLHSKPPIWRRVLVPSDITFGEVHDIIQDVMDWGNEHLHEFVVDGMTVGDPRVLDGLELNDEDILRLNQMAPFAKTRFRYRYDFGDSWDHEIVVEAVQPPAAGQHYPVCIAGERAGPPEDIGGVWGYANFVEAMADRKHPDNRYYRDWWSRWDAEAFDLEAVNRRLAR